MSILHLEKELIQTTVAAGTKSRSFGWNKPLRSHTINSWTIAVVEPNDGVMLLNQTFPSRQPLNVEGQFSVAKSEKFSWKNLDLSPLALLPAACLQSDSLKVDPGSCQPWAGPGQSHLTPLSICRSWRAEGSALFLHRQAPLPRSSLCQLHLLSPALSPICCYLWPTLIRSRAPQDAFLSQPTRRFMCCVISCYLCLSPLFFFYWAVGSHCITAPCYRTPSHFKGSASIRTPIIISNQSHFSI